MDHKSLRCSASPPSRRSGAMYSGEPTSAPVRVMLGPPSMVAIPKSVSTTRSSEAIMMLPGLMSRCRTPTSLAWCTARSRESPIRATRAGSRAPSRSSSSFREPPSTSSMTTQGLPSHSKTSWMVMTAGWEARAADRASRRTRACASSRSAGVKWSGSRTCLIATSRCSSGSWASQTMPIPPRPSSRRRTYRFATRRSPPSLLMLSRPLEAAGDVCATRFGCVPVRIGSHGRVVGGRPVRRAQGPWYTPGARRGRTAGPGGVDELLGVGHLQDVEGLVELGLGEFAVLDVTAFEDHLADGLLLLQRLLGDLGGLLVADVTVERGHDRGGGLRVGAALLLVRLDAVDAAVGEDPRNVGEQTDRLEHVARHHRQLHVELEVAAGAAESDGRVVAHDLRGDLEHGLAQDGVDLAGHDRGAGLQVGEEDLAQAGRGARTHPTDVVGDLGVAGGDGPQLAGELHQSVAGALRLEVVAGLAERKAGVGDDLGDDPAGETLGGVDAGTDRGTAQGQLGHARHDGLEALDTVAHLSGEAGELLAEGDRGGVHEVGTAALDHGGELARLAVEGAFQVPQSRDQVVGHGGRGGDVDGGGEDVVGRLRSVDVVIGVHVQAAALLGERGDDLVGVHVAGGARAGLEDVDGELVVPLATGDLQRGLADRLAVIIGDHAQLGVDLGRGGLDLAEGGDVRVLQPLARDREGLDGALCLGPELGFGRNLDLTHRVVLDAELTHCYPTLL